MGEAARFLLWGEGGWLACSSNSRAGGRSWLSTQTGVRPASEAAARHQAGLGNCSSILNRDGSSGCNLCTQAACSAESWPGGELSQLQQVSPPTVAPWLCDLSAKSRAVRKGGCGLGEEGAEPSQKLPADFCLLCAKYSPSSILFGGSNRTVKEMLPLMPRDFRAGITLGLLREG